MEKGKIVISKPYITQNGNLYRLNAEIDENGERRVLYAEVEEPYAKYLCQERADALVYLVLPVALRENYDIYSEAPVTGVFLHNINEILIPHLVMGDKNLYPISLFADTEDSYLEVGEGIGTAISCGVDSLYTVKQYTDNKYPGLQLTHLFIASVNAELWDTKDGDLYQWIKEHKIQFDRYELVSRELNLPLVKVYTNFFWYICSRDWDKYHHLWVHNYISMASVLVLKKLWKVYLFSSTSPYTIFNLHNNSKQDTDRHELLSNHVLSVPDFFCFSGGVKADRIQKTFELADYPIAQKVLHPCHKSGVKNCSDPTCGKCLRGLLTLDYYDKLDNMEKVFDIKRYRRDRKHYLWRLAEGKNNEFLSDLYKLFCEKFPEDMKKANESYERFVSPVPAYKFHSLQRWYSFSLQLLSTDKPFEQIKNFFVTNDIKKIYCSGRSNIGDKIRKMISDEIACFDYGTADIGDCDAALIFDTNESEIKRKRDILAKRKAKRIYTLVDLEAYVKYH